MSEYPTSDLDWKNIAQLAATGSQTDLKQLSSSLEARVRAALKDATPEVRRAVRGTSHDKSLGEVYILGSLKAAELILSAHPPRPNPKKEVPKKGPNNPKVRAVLDAAVAELPPSLRTRPRFSCSAYEPNPHLD